VFIKTTFITQKVSEESGISLGKVSKLWEKVTQIAEILILYTFLRVIQPCNLSGVINWGAAPQAFGNTVCYKSSDLILQPSDKKNDAVHSRGLLFASSYIENF